MHQIEREVRKDLHPQSLKLGRRRSQLHYLRLLDQRADHEGLVSSPNLLAHQLVGARSLAGADHLRDHGRPARGQLVED